MSSTDELITFIRAQLDEDERLAHAAGAEPGCSGWAEWYVDGMSARGNSTARRDTGVLIVRHSWPNELAHIVAHDPARVLREVEAKRRILDEYEVQRRRTYFADAEVTEYVGDTILPLLAAPYADRPGYQDEWRSIA